MSPPPIRLGVCGLGRAFSLMLPTFSRDHRFELCAAASPGEPGRTAFCRDMGGNTYMTMEELCQDETVDAIYIASPHQFHSQHVELAAAAGKHCLLEKPIAISLEQSEQIISAVERSGIKLVVGPSHSFDAAVVKAKQLIDSGEFGPVRQIHCVNYTDFLYRPRRPEELDTARGGGVVFSQGIHQIDIVRMLTGGLTQSVYAFTGNWDPARSTEGAYSALLHFPDHVFASLTYNGYGRYDSDELMQNISELGFDKNPQNYGNTRRMLYEQTRQDESALKRQRNIGFADTSLLQDKLPEHHEHFGMFVISCDKADLRLYPDEIEVYGDRKYTIDTLSSPAIPRQAVMTELYDAIVYDKPIQHSARWGHASLEVALGILESAEHMQSVAMHHQVPFDSSPKPV